MPEKMRLDPKNDFIFQLLFGKQDNKEILIDLLNAVIMREGKDRITDIESVENKKLDAERIMDKTCILDVKAKGNDGTIYNIEMQLTDKKNMGLRTTYYWAKMFVEQLKSGDKYQNLKQTITINILNYDIFPKIERFHTTFHIREDEQDFILTDRLEIHFIELEKFRSLRGGRKITDPLQQWLMFLDEKDVEILEVLKMSYPAIDRAEKILEWLSADEETLVTYRLREQSLHEQASMIADAKEEGIKEGEKKGKIEAAKAALMKGLDIDFVAEITGLPLVTIQQLKDELN
jgi:predicted transposase/invertase (TIGR01784 family)